jgi:two-component system chemotaxis response regulator CheB
VTGSSAPAEPTTVVIVDDSAVQRRFLHAAIAADPTLVVVGEARNGRDAVALVDRLRPGVVVMDLNLPVMSGAEAIERIMAVRPTPIVVYSAFVTGCHRANADAALAAGAVDVVAKPGPGDGGNLQEYADVLLQRLRVAARVRVITHPRGRLRETLAEDGSVAAVHPLPTPYPGPASGVALRDVDLVAIGASTGGPPALAAVLGAMPVDLAPAILVVQHMADGFIEGLASWLDGICPLPVAVGVDGGRLRGGTVTVAPSGTNLVVHHHLRVTTMPAPSSQHHVPGVDVTFSSVADAVGAAAVGVLLTGMGRDGAHGLRRMHEAGAFTIAQDEATSAVYGMPAAAVAAEAVDVQLPLPDIASVLLRLCPRRLQAEAAP